MDASALASAESWLSVIGWAKLGAALLVAIGVAIEFGADWIARPYERTVSEAREQQLGALRTETVRLSADADTARAQIETAQSETATARADIAKADARAAALENQGLSLQKQVADAQKAAADAGIREQQLRASVVWRFLTESQCAAIVKEVRGIQGSILLEYPAGDPEALLFAISLGSCFGKGAGWQLRTTLITLRDVLPRDLIVSGRDAAKLNAVRRGLTAAGVEFRIDEKAEETVENAVVARMGAFGTPSDVKVIIGSRPVLPP